MQLYYVLMSCAFLNVLAYNMRDYYKAVYSTNGLIDRAVRIKSFRHEKLNAFEYTIKRMVISGHTDFAFDKMKFMVAIPDRAERENLNRYVEFQLRFQQELTSVTGLEPVPLNSITKKPPRTPINLPSPEDPIPQLGEIVKVANILRKKTRKALWSLLMEDVFLPLQHQDHRYTDDERCFIVGLASSCINYDFARAVRVDEDRSTDTAHETGPICAVIGIMGGERKYIVRDHEFREVNRGQPHVLIQGKFGHLYSQLLDTEILR
ncbi:uncharacterized protein LOC126833102 isoform X1 [Adelges cooleyi]|uniref:uncharacterized protein LOC126833102 isoform X1 n=1 Tax=Adelges cooleyi TaxID=133065 RepID=UPI0021804FCB|nr:uncharacterized protein LOC126833102 isoform X1 [Adelges cooleyi]